MNSEQLKGHWQELKGKAQAKWGELTDDDVQEVAGEREALEGKLQQKYGKTKEEVREEVDKFMASL